MKAAAQGCAASAEERRVLRDVTELLVGEKMKHSDRRNTDTGPHARSTPVSETAERGPADTNVTDSCDPYTITG